MQVFSKVPSINFMALWRPMLIVAAILSLFAVSLVGVRGLNLGLDFTGGILIEAHFDHEVSLDPIRERLAELNFGSSTVQYFGSSADVLIRTAVPEDENLSTDALTQQVVQVLATTGETPPELRRVEFVGPQVGNELAMDGALATLFALLGILIYIAFRFEWKFGVGAVIALAHDAILVLGLFAIFGIEFDLTTLAAILAMIGYSLNDTIVVYDRIRENMLESRRTDTFEVINLSVNQTLARTIITSGSTLFVLFALLFFGGPSVHGFSIALIAGIIIGTYSTIYIASSMLLVLGVTRDDLLPKQLEEDDTP